MTRIIIKKLLWDQYNVEHIKKHNLTKEEIEEAVKNFIAHKKGKKGRYIAMGRSKARLISLVISRQTAGEYYLVTGRDSSKEERKQIYEKEKI